MNWTQIEHYFKTYKAWAKTYNKFNTDEYGHMYYLDQHKPSEQLYKLEVLLNKWSKLVNTTKHSIKIQHKVGGGINKIYWTRANQQYVLWPRKQFTNIKMPATLIGSPAFISHKHSLIHILDQLPIYYGVKKIEYIKIDLVKYYLGVNKDILTKAINTISKIKYGTKTRECHKINLLIHQLKDEIFVNGYNNLYLAKPISKYITDIVGYYIISRLPGRMKLYYVDDMLLLFRKDKRQKLSLIFEKVANIINKIGLKINYEKSRYGLYKIDQFDYLGYTIGKSIKVGADSIQNKKYKIVGIVQKIRIQDDKIINLKKITKKIKRSLFGFYHYYKVANNINVVMLKLQQWSYNCIRYYVWQNSSLNYFQVTKYLNNKKLEEIKIL